MNEPQSRLYEALIPADKELVDDSFDAIVAEFRLRESPTDMSDYAEHLIDAITKYLVESNPDHPYELTPDGWVVTCSNA